MDAGRLNLTGRSLDNSGGMIRTDEAAVLSLSDGLDNRSGLISAKQDVSIQTGTLQNGGGSLTAGRDLNLESAGLRTDGTLAAGRDMAVSLKEDFTNTQTLEAGRNLTLHTHRAV